MQSRLLQQRVRLQKKLPDLRKALDTVILLLSKQARVARRPHVRESSALCVIPPPPAGEL